MRLFRRLTDGLGLAPRWLLGFSLALWAGLPAHAQQPGHSVEVAVPAATAPSPSSSIYGLDTVMPVPDAGLAAGATDSDPRDVQASVELDRGSVSWYGGRFHGRRTASGERFDMYALTAAHPTLPFGTRIRVRRLDTGQEVEVRINDRGPHTRGRILDLSRAAAKALGVLESGESTVALLRP